LIIVPLLPALANKVTPTTVQIPDGLSNLFAINWLYGFVASCVVYYGLNLAFPDPTTIIPSVIHGEVTDSSDASVGNGEGDSNTEKGHSWNRSVEVKCKK